jgi:hypothetical protein
MEISADPDGTVYIRWHGGGAYAVVTSDGSARQEHCIGGSIEWAELEELDDGLGDYDDGFDAGLIEAAGAARDAIGSLRVPS